MLDTLVQWLHLMAAMAWVGGLLAMSLVVQPAMRQQMACESRLKLYHVMGRRFFYVKWGSWGILAATGLFKLWELRSAPEIFESSWGTVLTVKLSLIVIMIILSQLHSSVWGPKLARYSPNQPEYRAAISLMAFWGKVNLIVITAIVFCAACLRMGYSPF